MAAVVAGQQQTSPPLSRQRGHLSPVSTRCLLVHALTHALRDAAHRCQCVLHPLPSPASLPPASMVQPEVTAPATFDPTAHVRLSSPISTISPLCMQTTAVLPHLGCLPLFCCCVLQLMSAELYLRAHPELTALLTDFTTATLHARPDDVVQFAVSFFASIQPTHSGNTTPALQRSASLQAESTSLSKPSTPSAARVMATAVAQN